MSGRSLAKRRTPRAVLALAATAVLLAPACDSITDPVDRIPGRSEVPEYGSVAAGFTVAPATPNNFVEQYAPPGGVDLSWSAADGTATRFKIQRRELLAGVWGAWTALASVKADVTAWSDNVLPGHTYLYRMRACNPIGCSPYQLSGRVWTWLHPAAPSSLNATVADGQVNLTWTDMSEETGFQLERRDWNAAGSVWGPWTELGASPPNTPSYSDGTVAGAATYRYRVRACNPVDCSDWVPMPGSVTVPAG